MPYIMQREMTASQWTALNPVLLKGELGWETPSSPTVGAKGKKGDGATPWNSLGYTVQAAAPLDSPTFTGDPKAPTPATADNDTSIATTAFVKAQGYAPLASPTFTGDPKAPTPATSDNDTSVATTAFVKAAIAALIAGSPALLDTLDELAAALGDDPNFAATMTTALGQKAPIASPTFTGDPKAPTAAPGDNDTSISTTAFVTAAILAGATPTTTTITGVSGHTGTITFIRVGNLVLVSGGLVRTSGFSTSNYVIGTVPVGFRPVASFVPPASPFFNTADTFQYNLATDGTLQLRNSAASGSQQGIAGVYVAA